MKLKEYVKQLEKRYPADTDDPVAIVQQIACLAAVNLANKKKLPIGVGRGNDIDMDVVQAGVEAGLSRLKAFDGTIGDLKAFLYKTIAGTIQNYAWKRENRVNDSPYNIRSTVVLDTNRTPNGEEGELLVEEKTPETEMESQQSHITNGEALGAVFAYMGKEDSAMLLKDAQLGYNAAKRAQWAHSLGMTPGGLATKLVRLRKKAREWALSQH